MSPRDYASVPERITWTTGFRVPTDGRVLGALSTFANFKTGEGARVSIEKLVARAELPWRTVERALHRLEADGWITAHRRHRHATAWTINVERLAKDWIGAKLVEPITNLTATSGGQNEQPDLNLTATSGGQPPDLTATSGGQPSDLTATSGGHNPSTYEGSPVRTIPGQSTDAHASAFVPEENSDGQEGESAGDDLSRQTPALRDRAPGADSEPDDLRSRAEGTDQAPASDARISVRPPGDPGGDGQSRTRDRPHYQPTLGPLDVSASPEAQQRQQHWTRVGEIFKEAMTKQRKVK